MINLPDTLLDLGETTTEPADHRVDVVLPVEHLLEAVQTLETWGYLSAITGLDHGNRLEVLYHYCYGADVLTLRVSLDADTPKVPSIYTVFPQAADYERELMEMFGIQVTGTPYTKRLYLPEGWGGPPPLRKEAEA